MFRYELISKILANGNVERAVIASIKFNKNAIIVEGHELSIYSYKTGNYLGSCTIEQLIKYDAKIEFVATNTYLYYLANIEAINKYNAFIEA